MVTFYDLLDISNNWFTAYREKRDGRNPMTGSLLGDTFETNYNILGTPYVFKRPKRNGRNPQTGAFVPMTRSGVVNLNSCLPFGAQNICVHIADKTGYRNLNGSVIPDVVGLIEALTINNVAGAEPNTIDAIEFVDAYNNKSTFTYDDSTEDWLGFQNGSAYIRALTNDEGTVIAEINNEEFTISSAYRDLAGNLKIQGRNLATNEITDFIFIANAYPIFQP